MSRPTLHTYDYQKGILIVGTVFYIVLTYWARDHFFFWDSVQLASKHAHHFYNNAFAYWLLPNEMDSGHVPVFGAYLAMWWKIFGKSLVVSHVAMLPFLIGILYQVTRLLRKWIHGSMLVWATGLVLIDPTLLAQSILVSPDIVLIFGLLMAINAILEKKNIALVIAILILMLISMRGVMVTAALMAWHFYLSITEGHFIKTDRPFNVFFPYMPGIVLFVTYQYLHFEAKGWVFYHEASPWAFYFERANGWQRIKNAFTLGHRMVDFGRLAIWVCLMYITIKLKGKNRLDSETKPMAVLWLLMLICLSYSFIVYRLTGHRYLLPMYLLTTIILAIRLPHLVNGRLLAMLSMAALILGHLIIYPYPISQGWDSSLAHVPYYDLRKKMNTYLLQQGIQKQEVISAFPNLESGELIDLDGSNEKHTTLDNCPQCSYLLNSNVFNDFKKDRNVTNFIKECDVLHVEQSKNVCLILYKRKS